MKEEALNKYTTKEINGDVLHVQAYAARNFVIHL